MNDIIQKGGRGSSQNHSFKCVRKTSYSLPRLSVHNWEEEVAHRNESVNGNSSDLSSKPKVKLKPPCLNIRKVKTTPASKIQRKSPGN